MLLLFISQTILPILFLFFYPSPPIVNEFIGEDIQSYQSRSQMDDLPN